MRKAATLDKPKVAVKPAKLYATHGDLEHIRSFFDEGARRRREVSSEINNAERRIRNCVENIENYTVEKGEWERELASLNETLSSLPVNTDGERKVSELLAKVAAIPWIEQIKINANFLEIKTREDVLKTNFEARLVYDNFDYMYEYFAKPLALPLPQFRIGINLSGIGESRNWARNSSMLWMKLTKRAQYGSQPPRESGRTRNSRTHWACNRNGTQTSDVCLGDYADDFERAGRLGLVPLLDTLAIFLQTSGDQGAWTSRQSWGERLGFPLYNEHLYRKLNEGETFQDVKKNNRVAIPVITATGGRMSRIVEDAVLSMEEDDLDDDDDYPNFDDD